MERENSLFVKHLANEIFKLMKYRDDEITELKSGINVFKNVMKNKDHTIVGLKSIVSDFRLMLLQDLLRDE